MIGNNFENYIIKSNRNQFEWIIEYCMQIVLCYELSFLQGRAMAIHGICWLWSILMQAKMHSLNEKTYLGISYTILIFNMLQYK